MTPRLSFGAGGVSYGAYQMTSKPSGGTVSRFVNSAMFPWSHEFTGLAPGSTDFSDKWRSLVNAHPEQFKSIEHEFIKQTHFDIQVEKVLAETGIDLRYHSHAMNDVVWSTAVQQGPRNNIIVKAIKSLSISHEESKEYDSKLIDAIYAERGKKRADGVLTYFSRNSVEVQHGVARRFVDERNDAQDALRNEEDF